MAKSGSAVSTTKMEYTCNSFSLKEKGQALGSGSQVNTTFELSKIGKKPA